ncbi:MAG: hypothetical protein HOV80_27150 [Polyangiaceae bacterium]|nr:hypothetical protein [Polyangiaceae bacterium]
MRRTLPQKIAHYARVSAAVVGALAAGRFAFVAVDAALAMEAPPTAPAAQPASSGRQRAPSSAEPPRAASAAPAAAPGAPIQVQLLVNVGNERAEVFVDGNKVGSSPFVGTISCKSGAKVEIEVVITKGVVYGYERTCEPGPMRVDAAP